VVFPAGSFERLDETLIPSQGRSVWTTEVTGVGRFVDPDEVIRRWLPDGTYQTIMYPELNALQAVPGLHFDFDSSRIRDSFGRFVGVGSIQFPEEGVFFTGLRGAQIQTLPFSARPEAFESSPSVELVERVIFVNRDGTLRVQDWSFGRGRGYDPAHHGGGFLREGMAAAGVRREYGERLTAAEYAEVKASVLSVEYVVREARWR
jgi:hypothetical protein